MSVWTAILLVILFLGALGFWTIYMEKKQKAEK